MKNTSIAAQKYKGSSIMNYKKYKPYETIKLSNREWPSKTITKAPIWCSVDLRDGNQALEVPMNLEKKIGFFKYLLDIGFKQIEIGFPAASPTEFIFTRKLIEDNLIPDDVTIQVLTQSRKEIIERTFESLDGVKSAIVHLYNSTSTLQRDVVFHKSKKEIIELAVFGARLIRDLAIKYGDERFIFEYSPESFTGTEMDFAVEICDAVVDVWKDKEKVIVNLPATVEMSTPNVYADEIEYFLKNIKLRDKIILSLHTHNDRGTAVAASELGLLAGGERIEGTLFGNGERTGNADILNLALNLFSQGIDPKLDFSKINDTIEKYEKFTSMEVSPRHPYAGSLVYTAFSGSHQDAISKGMSNIHGKEHWEVPYLPIDPKDVGREYDAIIRINSQSGKRGVSHILEANYGISLPKYIQQDFGRFITDISDDKEAELSSNKIYEEFVKRYVNIEEPIKLINYAEEYQNGSVFVKCKVKFNGEEKELSGCGNGLVSAYAKALENLISVKFQIINYTEHSLELGTESKAITYIHIADEYKNYYYGCGINESITLSSLKALTSAVNKLVDKKLHLK